MTGAGGANRATAQPLLGVEAVSKSFGAVKALQEVGVTLYPDEVHGLVGESDAGKSALVDILSGVSEPDCGQLLIDGTPTVLRGTAAAFAAGVSVIPQQRWMPPGLSVAETIFQGRQPVGAGRSIRPPEMRRRAGLIFTRLGVQLDPACPASRLSVADRQIVEIAKAVSLKTRVILMDEPTTVLSRIEAGRLLGVIRALRGDGTAVLFVSHRLEEVFEVCQRVTIVRNGRLVRTAAIEDVTIDQVIHLIVGRNLDAMSPRAGTTPANAALEVKSLVKDGVFSDVSFQVRGGEIVALAGVAGSGRSEIARVVSGVDRHDAGRVEVRGCELPNASSQAAMNAGIAFVPEGRRRPGPFRRARERAQERARETRWARLLGLKYGPMYQLGHQGTVAMLGRLLARRPSVLIIDEPTRGTDAGTMARVHWLLDQLVVDGTAILMVSSELPEVLGMADRVLVLRDGALTAELTRSEADGESIMRAATGQTTA